MASVAVTFGSRSEQQAVGPLLLPLAASRHSAGLPSPHVPGAILIVSDSITQRISGGCEGAGERAGPGGPLLCIRLPECFCLRS